MPVVAESESQARTLDDRETYSDATLVGTGFAFLLVGAGTLSAAHRRRWRSIDLREDATTRQAPSVESQA